MSAILTGIITGITAVFASAEILSCICEKEEDRRNIYINADSKELVIKCETKGIPYENFEVFSRKEKDKLFLHIKGSAIVGESKAIKVCNEKYKLKGVFESEISTIQSFIESNEFIVKISLESLDKKIKVKHIRIK